MTTITKLDDAPHLLLTGAPPDAVDALDDELSYEMDGYQFTEQYRRGSWDGRVRLMRKTSGGYTFPMGLLGRVRSVLDALGVGYDVRGISRPGRGDLDLSWDESIELRPYQTEAVSEALRRGGGLVVMPTGAGKTLVGLRLLYELRRPALVTVHRQQIADQWCERIEDVLGVEPGLVYAGDDDVRDITVGLYQTLQDVDLRRLDVDVLLADEAHTVGADVFSSVVYDVNAPWRWGFSATPEREDGATLRVIGGCGDVVCDLSPSELIERGYLADPRWHIIDTPRAGGPYRDWQAEYEAEIVTNDARNELIKQVCADAPRPIYVHVERINHGERLEAMIPGATFVHGSSSDRENAISDFKNGEIEIFVSTLLGEGFDLPEMRTMVMAGGLKTGVGTIQKVGRVLRPDADANIVDFVDKGRFVNRHSEERLRAYSTYYGTHGPR